MNITHDRHSPNFNQRPWTIKAVVWHATGGRTSIGHLCDPAPVNADGQPDPRLVVSAHYLISKKGEIFQLVDEGKRAWHAGADEIPGHPGEDPNDISIGIELENLNNDKDPYPDAQVTAAIELAQQINVRYALTRAAHVTHHQVAPTRKVDPLGLDVDDLLDRIFVAVHTSATAPTAPPLAEGDTRANKTYRVITNTLYVRQAPNTHAVIAARVYYGQRIEVDVIKTKGTEAINGDVRWGHLANGIGFVSMRYVQEA